MKQFKLPLPIDSYLPQILEAISNFPVVMVKASPGSGKTTRLPWAIAKGLSKKVVVLEPRRLAAKMAAQRVADEENLVLGEEVGFHFRFEKKTSDKTQLTFYTEGTFLKKFLNDKTLKGIDIVILDEFHERHLETDLALALLRDVQRHRDLKVILMSATLDLKLEDFFSQSTTIEINSPLYPVDVHYLPNQPSILNQTLELKVKKAVDEAAGDTLVFLPGMREMLKVKNILKGNYEVFLLHADLSKEEQNNALISSDHRKVILATNIAESSLTIPGIRVVIDSGIQREAHYSPWNGLKLIQDSPVTKSSAIQRAGRAGRTGPGVCFRLYSQQDYNEREEFTIPAIQRADLTDVCLMVTGTSLAPQWFDPPAPEKWKKAKELLERLGALDKDVLTDLGRKMLQFPLDARLARILISGEELPRKEKEKLLNYICYDIEEDRSGVLWRRLGFYLSEEGKLSIPWEECVLNGFIDQVARYRQKQNDFIHFSGKTLKAHYSLHDLTDGFYLILNVTQKQEAIKVLEIEEGWLWEMEPFPLIEEEEVQIEKTITIRRKTKLGSIVIEESILTPSWNDLSGPLQQKIIHLSQSRLKQEIDSFKTGRYFEKVSFWARIKNFDLSEMLSTLDLKKFFSSQGSLSFENLESFLKDQITESFDMRLLDKELPDKLNLGGKRDLTIHYPQGMDPYLEAPIQDFYGLQETPSILSGQVPLTLKLLGPHKRPIQVTKDLKNFWNKTYQEMKKEYQRDYPRHYWPDKPWEAKPFLLKSHLPKA